MNRLITALVAAGGLAASASAVHANVEIGGTAGIHTFSTKNELGVDDSPTADSERNSSLFGVRLGLYFHDIVGVEGEFGFIPTESRQGVFDVWDITYRGHLVLQARARNPENKLIPFVLAGGGAMQVVHTQNSNLIGKDTDAELYFGVGLKYRVDNGWGLRIDGRMLFPPSSENKSVTEDFEVLLSIYREWGRKEIHKPVGPKDSDGDGITDDVDKCPLSAEDKDGFQDADGCPDPDNDGDGIPDSADKCPNDPEDKDGFQDADGCPDLDNDGDGIPDALDQCPNEPEDKDGFQDADGCPDPDNDGDGIPDAQDKCPNQPETKNGYQDADGCPDEIPAKLKQFTGAIQGINFKTGSADILPSSHVVLDKAVAVLKEFSDLHMEIQGHTDDVKFIKRKGDKFEDNMQLSQARAESVMSYLVSKGIDQSRLTAKGYGHTVPLEDPTNLTGAKLNAARTKNRRVEFTLITQTK
jgi:outer membrane protein OmpA-like peptidoglycan-associated protein